MRGMSANDYVRLLDLLLELADKYGKTETRLQTRLIFSSFKGEKP